ncbi:MAG: ABC transporter permease, partial [Gammaproteobacteria bacterium]|nr:ABC transporter permease [Gammaproteobacteria bacterium]
MIKPVILWTDALVYLLIAAVIAFAWYARGREHLRAPWARVMESRLAIVSLVVLSAYVSVALLDSLHFRPALEQRGEQTQETFYSVEVLSVLDIIARPLKEKVEKTYSAPFATRLYAREAMEGPGGVTVWDYPRLRHGGAHLADPDAERFGDIARRALHGAAAGGALWLLLAAAVVFVITRARSEGFVSTLAQVVFGRTRIPWRDGLLAAGILIVL